MERSWGVLGEGGGSRSHYNSGYDGPGSIKRTAISRFVVLLFFKVGITLMLGIQYKYNSYARIIIYVQT